MREDCGGESRSGETAPTFDARRPDSAGWHCRFAFVQMSKKKKKMIYYPRSLGREHRGPSFLKR